MRKQNLMSVALRKGVFALCLLFMSNPPLMAQDSGVKISCWFTVPLLTDRTGQPSSLSCRTGATMLLLFRILTSLREDVAATERVLERQNGNVLLVGHSWAGAVITRLVMRIT